jgi:hypothetical protein
MNPEWAVGISIIEENVLKRDFGDVHQRPAYYLECKTRFGPTIPQGHIFGTIESRRNVLLNLQFRALLGSDGETSHGEASIRGFDCPDD